MNELRREHHGILISEDEVRQTLEVGQLYD